jgi:hypothetical protein
VPQVELPERTHELITAFIGSAGTEAASLPWAAAGSA